MSSSATCVKGAQPRRIEMDAKVPRQKKPPPAEAEVSELRACINDLVGIVALPAIWKGASPSEIVSTVLDMLLRILRLDFAFLRLKNQVGESMSDILRVAHSRAMRTQSEQIEELLKGLLTHHFQNLPQFVESPSGDGRLSIVPVPLGLGGEIGVLMAGSRREGFPAQTERLLLNVAANQVALGLQQAWLLNEQKRVAEELDRRVAQKTEELAAANKKLQDRERRIGRLIDSNIIGIVIWDLDGQLIDANDAFLRMVGYDREDLQAGLRWFDMTPPEWQEAHARYEAEELKATGKMQAREKEYFRKDGSRVPVLIGAACFEDQPSQGVAYILDLSEQKRIEEALRSSQAYLTEAQKLTHTGSCAIDGTSREIRYWSDEMFQIFGFDPQQGPPTWDQFMLKIHPDDRDKLGLASDATFRAKFNCDAEFRIVKPDGTVRHIHGVGHPVYGPTGELIRVIGTMVDVTERKRAEEVRERARQLEAELTHTNRMSTMGELTASLAHEIKQPIGAAVTNAEACVRLIDRREPDLPDAREAALEMIKDVRRAAEIIDRVRTVYQRGSSQLEMVDLGQLIEEMAMMMGGEATRHSVTIHIDLTRGLPNVMADRVQLQQAFMNLILNGIEAMDGRGGDLKIKSQLALNGHLQVSISDTGVGVPLENIDRIFDAFFTTKPRGTGLGLVITRSIIQSHGGHIWATANSGAGATFHFTLPVREDVGR